MRGWDPDAGQPTRANLEELGIGRAYVGLDGRRTATIAPVSGG